jgi:tRNA U38,U39,U40 pseudouridine synthase TruA
MVPQPNTTTCKGCGLEFPSKNAIFRHLKKTNGACLSSSDHADFQRYVVNCQREKVIVLYGYWLPHIAEPQSHLESTTIRNGDDVAQFLVDTVEIESGVLSDRSRNRSSDAVTEPSPSLSKINRSYGHISRSDIVAQEEGTSAITEVLVAKLPPLVGTGREAVHRWIDRINQALRDRLAPISGTVEIRVLGRQSMTVNNFNAETDVSHRRIEYLIPAEFLLPESRFQEAGQLPSFSDGLRSRKFISDPNDDKNGDADADFVAIEDGTSHHLPYCQSPSPEILALLTSFKRKMQSLTTHIVDLDTNDIAAVFEKQSHAQKRQRNREYRNNKGRSTKASCTDNQHEITVDDADGPDANACDDANCVEQNSDNSKSNLRKSKKKRTVLCSGPDNKKEMVLRRKRYHNFTPTVMAHEFLAYRRMNRFYHRATLRFDSLSPSARRDSSGADGRLASTSRPFLALSLSGDLFLTGQACHAVGLFIALARGVIDENFVDCVFDEEYPHLVPTPAAPSFAMYAGDVFYINIEGKAKSILTPRKTDRYENGWNDDATIEGVRKWQSTIRVNVARAWLAGGLDSDGRLAAEKTWTETVLDPWAEGARKQLEEYKRWKRSTIGSRAPIVDNLALKERENNDAASFSPTIESIDPAVPPVFEKVLFYLRKANSSGMWPSTTLKRQLVMISNVSDNDNEANRVSSKHVVPSLSMAHRKAKFNNNEERSSAYAFVEGQGGASGSFSLGAMPGDKCIQPKGNQLFPELMKAAFELEAALCPNREPSSTIAVNRNAQFRPHTDSGAGAGQSTSLIVGLGTYAGGELMVEGKKHDIRYNGIEFDGWKQRHWTMPFLGERYSLVWFTPKGCEGINFIHEGSLRVPGDSTAGYK